MSDEETPVTLTIDDIRVMRQIIAWRKANEIEFVRRRVYGAPYWIDTFGTTGPPRRSVTIDTSHFSDIAMPTTIGLHTKGQAFEWIGAISFRQGVDLLVALDYLPARFSTAYGKGWDKGAENVEHGSNGPAFWAVMPVWRYGSDVA